MRLAGWNWIPSGYGLRVDRVAAPWWLRAWVVTPLLDRFAYPVMLRRGHAWLTAHPGETPQPVPAGWIVRDAEAHTAAYRHVTWHSRRRTRLRLPAVVTLPGGRRFERRAYLFWRVRLPLWVALGALGGLGLGWAGGVAGLGVAAVVEVAFSYRRWDPTRGPRGDPAGVREPRRPYRPITPVSAAADPPEQH